MFSAKQILDTQNDIFGNILGGAAKFLEGIVDFGAGAAGLFGADTQEFVKRDFTQEFILDPVSEGTAQSYVNSMGEQGQRITRGVAQGVGQMLPVVLTGGLATGLGASAGLAQGISLATIGVGAGGGGVETALTDGASQEQAMLYGTAVGALEVATEKLVGGVWDNITGAGIADKVLSKVVRSTNPAVRKGLKLVLDAGGEGVEEMVSEVVEPYIRRATYDKDADNATMEQVLEAGLIGALTAVTYQGSIGNVIKRKSGAYVNETINDLKALESKENTLWANNRLTAEEQAKIDKQRTYLTTDLQKSVNRLSAKKQASIQEVVKPYLTIDKVASDYVSRGVRASQLEGVQVATELTTEQGVKWDKVKQQHNKLRSLGLVSSELVLADFTDRNVRGMQKENLILIDKAELDSDIEILGQKVSKATQTMVHELTHFAEGTKEYEEFADLAYRTAVASGDLVVADMIKEGIDTKDKVKIQEGVAIFSELIFNESSIDRIANANRSFGYKILNRITEVIKKLKGEPTITPILRKAEKLWLKALEKGQGRTTERYSGYSGYSMSNNAVEAYQDGEMPLSKWTKEIFLEKCEEEGISLASVKNYKKYLVYSSWHHTSMFYNKTDFYKIDFDLVRKDLTEGVIKELTEEEKDERYRKSKAEREETERREAERKAEKETEKKEFWDELSKTEPILRKSKAGNQVATFTVKRKWTYLGKEDLKKIARDFNLPSGTIVEVIFNEKPLGESEDIRYSHRDSNDKKLTEAQAEFFKDSKVRDEQGRLLEVYHGGFEGNVFNGRGKGFTYNPNSIYLTNDKDVATAFAGRKSVKSLYANIKNPIILDADGSNYTDIPISDDAPQSLKDYFYDTADADNLPVYAEKYGYDGVIIKNVREGVGGDAATEVIALKSNQIKLTTNLNPTANEDIRYSHRDSYYQSEVRVRYAEYLADTLISKTKRGLYSANEIASVLFATDAVIPGKGRLLENLHESFNRKTRTEALKDIDTAIEYIIDRAFLLDTQRSVVVAKASETLNELNESINTLDLSEVREEIRSKSDKAQTILMRWGKNGGIKATAQQALDLEAKYQEALKEVRRGLRAELTASDTKELRDNLRKGLVEIYDKKYPQEKIINLVEQYRKEVDRLINKIHDVRLYNKEYNKALRSVERLKQKTKHKFGGYLADESLNAWLKDITALTFRDALKTPDILREKIRSFNTIYGNEALSDYRVGEIQEAIDFIIKGEGKFSGLDMQALRIVIDGTNHLYATYKQTYRTVGKEQELFEFEPLLTSSIPEIRETQMGKVGRLEAYMLDPEAVARKLDNYENGINQFWLHEAQQGELRAKVELMKMEKKLIAWKKQNKKHSLERIITLNGKKIPLEIAMSLYMTSLREGAKQGLEKNGWVYYEKNKLVTIEPQGVDKIQAEIQAQLTETDLSLIELINELMETAKKLKVETDNKRLGFTNATEEYYFPIQRFSSVAGIETEYGQTSVNSFSFNKDTTKNILPLKISSVLSVVEEHISGVALYYGLGTVVDTFNRTYNSRINGTTARLELAKVWSGADSYYKKFLADIQGIDTDSKDQLNRYISIIRSGFATYQLAANPKVLLTQASAVIAGTQKIGLGNTLKGMGHKISFKDMDKYCPFVELRNFDHGAFRSMTVLDKGAVKGKGAKAVDKIRAFTEKLMIGIQYMDRLSIGFLWNGAQQQAVREGYKLGTEENKERAGVILENTVRETQANYVPSERSAMMRSKNEITKFLTMFTADANKLVSRFIDGIGEQKALRKKLKANPNDANIKKRLKTAHNKTVKAISAIITVNLYLTLLAQLFNKFYNRDEEEPLNAFLENFAGNMFGMLPIFRDISSFLIEGYEVDLALTSTINDILKATKSNYEIIEKAMNGENIQEFEVNKNVRDVLYSVGVLFGIPFRNVNNLVYGTTNLISKEAGYKYNAMFYQTYTTDLDKALKEEDYGLAQSIMATMLSRNQMTGDTEKLVKLYEAGHKVLPKTVNDTITVDTVEYELSQSQRKQFYEIYSKANTKVILDSNLPDEAKAYAIRQAYSFYWDSAVEETLGIESKKSLIAKQVDANKLALALGYAETVKGDNRKERIERYLRSKFNRREIKLILDYMGYVVH